MRKKYIALLLVIILSSTSAAIYQNVKKNEYKVKLPLLTSTQISPTNFNNIDPTIKVYFNSEAILDKSMKTISLNLLADYTTKINIPVAITKINSGEISIRVPILLSSNYDFIINKRHLPFTIKESTTTKLKPTISNCNELNGYELVLCLKRYFYLKTIKEKDVTKTLGNLNALLAKQPELKTNCHAYIHVLGQTAGILSNDFAKDYNKGSNICEYGYYHGLMEGFAMKYTNDKLTQVMKTFCSNYQFGFNQGSCYHSLGHMVWIRTGGEFSTSVKLCRELPSDANSVLSPQENCISGVAMNWAHAYQDAPAELKRFVTTDPEEPSNICLTIKDLKQQSGCWAFAGGIYNKNITTIKHYLDLCQTLPEVTSNTCWLNVGFLLGFETSTDFTEATRLCSTAKFDNAMWSCYGNLISNRTILNSKENYADYVCAKARKDQRSDTIQCKIMQEQEEIRRNMPVATHILH